MNAQEQQAIVEKLSQSGITVERAEVEGGKIVSWTPIPWEAVTGRMMQFGWRFVFESQAARDHAARPITRGNLSLEP